MAAAMARPGAGVDSDWRARALALVHVQFAHAHMHTCVHTALAALRRTAAVQQVPEFRSPQCQVQRPAAVHVRMPAPVVPPVAY